jgi:hypothetical protein
MRKPTPKTVREAIRASVPDAKLRKARIVLTEDGFQGGNIGGYTQYEREHGGDVVKIGAPIGDDSRGITIRGHETRHATRHKPQRKKPVTENEAMASQIVDDVNIECSPIPEAKSGRAYRRAHLATAMRDLRTIVNRGRNMRSGIEPNTVQGRNAQLLASMRVGAMLRHYATSEVPMPDELKVKLRGLTKLRNIIGQKTFTALSAVQRLAVKRTTRNRAISMLSSLMEVELTPEEIEFEEREARTEAEILMPVTEGGAIEGHMAIRNLIPKSVPCSKEKQISRRFAPDGVIINGARFVNAIVSGQSHGLFARRTRTKPGGTILIDASGSMAANAKNLTALCELCPTSTVAYYSGQGSGGRGELVVYALNGKRYGKELPENSIHGGNAVDLPAIKWMMRLPKPWTLISDLGFCGGVLGSEQVAHALVERCTQRGDMIVHKSLDAAYEAFGGKGELKNE